MATWADLVEAEAEAIKARKALGADLRAWREAAGLTLAAVGWKIGRDQSAIFKAEAGQIGGKVGREYAELAGLLDRWRGLTARPSPCAMNAAARRALVGGGA